jgi:hypothetical protein
MQRTATGDIRRLRTDLMAKLSKLGQTRSQVVDPAQSSGITDILALSRQPASTSIVTLHGGEVEGSKLPRLADRLVSSSARLARNEGLTRARSDCRDLGTAFGDCGQRLSPPCVAWGTPSCRRNAMGMSMAVEPPMAG